jgi:hypothetical protein
MKVSQVLFIAITLASLFILFLYHYHANYDIKNGFKSYKSDLANHFSDTFEKKIMDEVSFRISESNVSLSKKTLIEDDIIITSLSDLIRKKDLEIKKLKDEIDELAEYKKSKFSTVSSSPSLDASICNSTIRSGSNFVLSVKPTDLEQSCEERFGMKLIEEWKKSKETWCKDTQNSYLNSELTCYPYHQHHKKLDGRGPDVFCEATNFIIDFSKVILLLL